MAPVRWRFDVSSFDRNTQTHRYLQLDPAESAIIFNCESRPVHWPDCQGHANQNNTNEKFMKNPFLAFVLSLVVPGAGIAYLGQWLVGLVNLLVVIALWFSLTLSFGDVVERYVYSHYVIFAFFSAWVAMNLSVLKKMKDSIAVKQVESAAVSSTASMDVSSEPFIGQIQMFAFGFAPVNWAPCDGQVLQIKEHMALFGLLGNKYGGDGLSTFALPNLTAFEQNAGIRHFIAINGVFPTRS